MKILMGTQNPGKIEGARQAFVKYFEEVEIEGIAVNSEVGNQPTNDEIMDGAKNRVKNLKKYAKENNKKADFYIASEAGITNLLGEWMDFNLAVIENEQGEQSVGSSAGFQIPQKYVLEVMNTELGKVMDRVLEGKELSKANGGIGVLTKDEITRVDLTRQAFIMALIKFLNGDIWK